MLKSDFHLQFFNKDLFFKIYLDNGEINLRLITQKVSINNQNMFVVSEQFYKFLFVYNTKQAFDDSSFIFCEKKYFLTHFCYLFLTT